MLEKMGWSKGKGLGAQEQGATEHIKVQVKNNHLGLGAAVSNEDNWIAHQDDFNQLLAALSTCHGQETADTSDNKEKKCFNLEEKSKISKHRVHYKKFTKGKDLSSRSKTDLDCIFGKRQSKKTPEDDSSPSTPDGDDTSTMTTTSAFTIQEYFAQQMAKLQNKPQGTASGPDIPETPVEWKRGKKGNKEATDKNVENYPQPKVKRPKRKKPEEGEENREPAAGKRGAPAEQQLRATRGDENADTSAEVSEDSGRPPEDQDFASKLKKRREKKNVRKPVVVAVDTWLDESPVRKKKKKKKGSK
ncbi:PREDICTED: PIN2/TERF1-interacting telomerase inhibitor 1 [Galeopterus variegatus]|uniref:PIN2/TERF1-interacting telomerase inhibitor 1 n=1 Tax=Galeopterus variegatus TaxID=482537 RepID=A0ABM0QPH1_GALVR|nr:PREDICTED: PIN2/TERF1-interacting telomerase inhibitor 1 [Galeopterus variegatus]